MSEKLSFLKSRRFWCLIAIAIIGVLKSEGVVPSDIADALILILGGFIGIRTIDKVAETISK